MSSFFLSNPPSLAPSRQGTSKAAKKPAKAASLFADEDEEDEENEAEAGENEDAGADNDDDDETEAAPAAVRRLRGGSQAPLRASLSAPADGSPFLLSAWPAITGDANILGRRRRR